MGYSNTLAELILALTDTDTNDTESVVHQFIGEMQDYLPTGRWPQMAPDIFEAITEQLIALAETYEDSKGDQRRANLIKLVISADRVESFMDAPPDVLNREYKLDVGEDGIIGRGFKSPLAH